MVFAMPAEQVMDERDMEGQGIQTEIGRLDEIETSRLTRKATLIKESKQLANSLSLVATRWGVLRIKRDLESKLLALELENDRDIEDDQRENALHRADRLLHYERCAERNGRLVDQNA